MLLLASTINLFNEKELKYKMDSDGAAVKLVFGMIAKGQKTKIEIIPREDKIIAHVMGKEKEFTEASLLEFVDTVLEIKAVQLHEESLIEKLSSI